jgi:hypothetical protein
MVSVPNLPAIRGAPPDTPEGLLALIDARLDALEARLDTLDERRQIRRARLDGVEFSNTGPRLSGDDR